MATAAVLAVIMMYLPLRLFGYDFVSAPSNMKTGLSTEESRISQVYGLAPYPQSLLNVGLILAFSFAVALAVFLYSKKIKV